MSAASRVLGRFIQMLLAVSKPFNTAVGLVLVVVTMAAPRCALGQAVGSGAVAGHVRGPGGVSVPGATVEISELGTGERRQTWTDEAGNYVLDGLPPGTYKLEVSLVGFRTDIRNPVPVTVGQVLKVNIALVLSASEESAANPSRGPASERASGNLLALAAQPQSQIRELAGEGFPQAETAGGSEGNIRFAGSPEGVSQGDSEPAEGDASASASNSFLLAGSAGITASTPGNERGRWQGRGGPDQMAPGFGGGGSGGREGGFGGGGGGFGGGGQNAMGFFWGLGGRRPRMNRLRGNLMESYTNSNFDARPYPLNVSSSPRIPGYTEQLGLSIGGPLYIPHILTSKDNTSFFVHYNLQHSKNPFDSYSTVPTALEREGDFSQTVIPAGPLAGTTPAIYEPSSGPLGPRTAFPGNVIPPGMINSAARGLLQYIPLPNLPATVQNLHLQESLPSTKQRFMARIGQQIGKKDSLSGMYFFNSTHTDSVGNFPALTSRTSVRQQNLNLNDSYTFAPEKVNTLLFNFNRSRTLLSNPFANTDNVAAALGILGVSEDPLNWGLPGVGFTNFGGLSLAIPSLTRSQTTRAVDTMLINSGKHNVRFGGELRRVDVNTLTDPNARGTFSFTGYTTSDFDSAGQPVAGTGFDFADFLLGLPYSTSVRYGTSANYLRAWYGAGFVQDDWRATNKFTVLAGLRYEYFAPFTEKYGHLSDLELSPAFASASLVTGLNPGALPPSLLHGEDTHFTPRVGIAYRPSVKHTLVLRAGYGMFYDESVYQRIVTSSLVSEPPFAQASTLLTSPAQVLTLQNGFPALGANVLTNTYAVDPGYHTPYAQTWNFSLQDEILRNVVLDVGYIGTVGHHLDLLLGPNPAGSNHTANALEYIFETSGSESNYNALQVSLRRQFHHGLSLWGRYTYSKSLDDASAVGGTGSAVVQNYLDPQADYSRSSFDRRHQFLLNYNYELPFGDRKRYANRGAMSHVLGNWQISGVTTLQTGLPATAFVLGNISSNGRAGAYNSLRANATGLAVSLSAPERSTLKYFNTAAFALPVPGELGDAGRNTITGPPLYNFNMSLDRQIVFSRERGVNGDFRIAANNIFNTPNFGGLGTVVNSSTFGRVTSVGSMRAITLSFRLRF